jgi:hypothetical protein
MKHDERMKRTTFMVTGSRHGMTPRQVEMCKAELIVAARDGYKTLIHGACKGVDAQVVDLAEFLGFQIEAFPSNHQRWTDQASLDASDVVHPVSRPLDRNRFMALASTLCLAFPRKRSRGTWHAIGCAQGEKSEVTIIFADGSARRISRPDESAQVTADVKRWMRGRGR